MQMIYSASPILLARLSNLVGVKVLIRGGVYPIKNLTKSKGADNFGIAYWLKINLLKRVERPGPGCKTSAQGSL